jgi:hypothetical protein
MKILGQSPSEEHECALCGGDQMFTWNLVDYCSGKEDRSGARLCILCFERLSDYHGLSFRKGQYVHVRAEGVGHETVFWVLELYRDCGGTAKIVGAKGHELIVRIAELKPL